MDAEQLWDTTMNPEHRTLRQATIENAAKPIMFLYADGTLAPHAVSLSKKCSLC